MLALAKKHVDRAGHRPVQVRCVLAVNSVCFPTNCTVQDQSILSICFTKGVRSCSTNNFVYNRSQSSGDTEVSVQERLEMSVILYKDLRSRQFQAKSSKLVLRQLCKQGVLSKYSFKAIGRCNLELNEIANGMDYGSVRQRNGKVIFENMNGVTVKFSISLTIPTPEEEARQVRFDDNVSTTSSVSELTETTEVACHSTSFTDRESPAIPIAVPTYSPHSYGATSAHGWSVYEDSISEEEGGSEVKSPSSARAGSPHLQPAPSDAAPPPVIALPTITDESQQPTESPSTSVHGPGSETPALTGTSEPIISPRQLRAGDPEASQVFAQYDRELEIRAAKIAELESALAAQRREAEQKLQALTTELAVTATSLRRERIARETIADATLRGDQELQLTLQLCRQEAAAATARCTTLLADLAEARSELQQCREQLAVLETRLAEETALTQQAACVAAAASAQRAEAEDENRVLLGMVIDLKV
jgi:hypothetical protein